MSHNANSKSNSSLPLFLQTPHGYLTDALIVSWAFPQSITLVLPMFTYTSLISRLFLHIQNFLTYLPSVSALTPDHQHRGVLMDNLNKILSTMPS